MDDKANRRLQTQRSNNARIYEPNNLKRRFSKYTKLLNTHKQSLLTSVLLLIMTVLLFGVVTQLQAPTVGGGPEGITNISYSTFEAQLQAGNVLAVTIQGNDLTGLLISPIGKNQSSAQASTPGRRAAELVAWSHFTAGSTAWAVMPNSPALDPARTFYTRLPANGDATLTSLLLSKHVNVTTVPLSQSSVWLSMLWRFVPLILFVLLFFAILAPRKGVPSLRSMDDRITQLGKNRARRFERAKERKESTPPSEKVKIESSPQASLRSSNKPTIVGGSAQASGPTIGSPPPIT